MSRLKNAIYIVGMFALATVFVFGKYSFYVPLIFLSLPAFLIGLLAIPIAKYNKIPVLIICKYFGFEELSAALHVVILFIIAFAISVIVYFGTIGGIIYAQILPRGDPNDFYFPVRNAHLAIEQANPRFMPYFIELTSGYMAALL